MKMCIRKITVHIAIYVSLLSMAVSCQETPRHNEAEKIIVYLQLSAKLAHPEPQNYALKDKMDLAYLPVRNTEENPEWQTEKAIAYNGYVKWTFYVTEPVKVNFGFGSLPILSPGDSVIVRYNGEEYEYLGKGKQKLTCWNNMAHVGKNMPTVSNNYIKSVDDYYKWVTYLDNKIAQQISILDSSKDKISSFEYEFLKVDAVARMESDRIQIFRTLRSYCKKDSGAHISVSDLNTIWDSTQYHPLNSWQITLSDYYYDTYNLSEFNTQEVWRRFNFDTNADSMKSNELRNYLYYTSAKQKFKGLLRERLLAEILTDQTKKGFKNPITQVMLKDYYSQPGFPEYKQQVKKLEEKVAEKLAKK